MWLLGAGSLQYRSPQNIADDWVNIATVFPPQRASHIRPGQRAVSGNQIHG
jgi:hypothetical protein